MTPEDTKKILAKAALVDNRMVDLAGITAWHEIIGHLDFDEALEAVTRFRQTSTDYLMPAHVIAVARRIHSERSTDIARTRALEAHASRSMDFADYQRKMNTPEFRKAFKDGEREGDAWRAYHTEYRRTGRVDAASAEYRRVFGQANET